MDHEKLPEFNLEQIKTMPASRVVIIFNGYVCDVTEFLKLHPGGGEILLKYNRQDATKEFEKIGHSSDARELLKEYVVGYVANTNINELEVDKNLSVFHQKLLHIKNKLMTHEDPFFFHKIFGLLILVHIFMRSSVMVFESSDTLFGNSYFGLTMETMFPVWLMLLFAICHGFLSLSSLIFHVPKHANQNKPMIHSMFRAHSICFALRAVLVMIVDLIIADPQIQQFIICLIVISCFYSSDIISDRLTASDDRYKTTDSMPYWPDCSPIRQNIHKLSYAFAQYLASVICIFGTYESVFFTLPAIQGAAFLMTLTRKNLISPYAYHQIYTFLLFYAVPFFLIIAPIKISLVIAIAAVCLYLRTIKVNKYLIWGPILLVATYKAIPDDLVLDYYLYYYFSATIILLCAIFMYLSNKLERKQLNGKGGSRLDLNNRVLSCNKISTDGYELIIRTKMPIYLNVGQHILIQVNDSLSRKYTPIWHKYLPETDQTLIALRIKKYTNEHYMTASSYLASRKDGSVLALFGPHGSKYYCVKNKSIIDSVNNKAYELTKNNIYLISAGTGITPIYQLAKNIISNQSKHVKLITCDRTFEHQIMKDELIELKKENPKLLNWTCFLSGQNTSVPDGFPGELRTERLSGIHLNEITQAIGSSIVILCGPNGWQDMICENLKMGDAANAKLNILCW
ncbi:cytochrome b5 domain-containing protein [Paraglaciecola sp. MB-3u-78]|uniref:cytochrome b5 domain-containing protein n=1 Tax=Paraglaciecola sp. MB-3u-78 TaxID=2058332 RepID=UPI000C323CA3|nr:cytochrome b5 domain-containing protein [Paraglaciecola sp. MB-3u-78]PKG99351.1 hypothetical protein CXF95_08845 [Paraglaciecola sp. MB-3u-78]